MVRRRRKPRLDAEGNLLEIPAVLARFNPADWQGVSEYHCWELWWDAREEWAQLNRAPDDVIDIVGAMESQPLWTPADMARVL